MVQPEMLTNEVSDSYIPVTMTLTFLYEHRRQVGTSQLPFPLPPPFPGNVQLFPVPHVV